MLSKKEEEFLKYWEQSREKERSVLKQFFPGLPFGLALGAAILALLDSGWYERANMEAQSQSSPVVIFLGIVAIVAFTGFFYKRYRWEMNEQAYQELKQKAAKDRPSADTNK
jgi:glycerol uptake facilitator-like aquaporin